MMSAAVYHGPDEIRIEQPPLTRIGPGETLLQTPACGLCAGEAMPWYKSQPQVLDHEPIGEVVKVGTGAADFRVGDRVFVNHHVGRINSHLSRRGHFTRNPFCGAMKLDPGGVCEYYRVSAQHLALDDRRLPDGISNKAAVTIELWSCVLSGLKVCNIQPGDTVAVVGAGFIGQRFIQLAPLFGAGNVIALDFSDRRLERAREFGATHTINPGNEDAAGALREINDGRLADTVVAIAPYAPVWEQALKLVEIGGCLHLGAPLPPETSWVRYGHAAYFDQIAVTSRCSSDHTDTSSYIRLQYAGRVQADRAVTRRFDIREAGEGFRLLVKAEHTMKVAVYPHGVPPGCKEMP